jgi:hypothetical protein
MNFCVTDGESVIATRYISSRHEEAASLWFSSGTTFSEYAPGGHYRMSKTDKRENIIMVASEPLTFEKADWMEIKTNHMVAITPRMNLLQIPIVDRFFVSPSAGRETGFASEKGFLSPRPGALRGSGVEMMENGIPIDAQGSAGIGETLKTPVSAH